ncbi:Hcp family type VI secretion system effector [Methylomicrobium lacus]|uniref:Hcp family type VI secretion system effector n=1 Tax=Methylomicrobium lacus TaxID=136992 RepID=UPI0035A97F90
MAVDMFLKIETIEGESRDKTHGKEIDVLAWSWGASNSGTAHLGGGAGAGKVNIQDLSVTKYVDKASTELFAACCAGKHFTKATLTVRKAGTTPLEYIIIEMEEVLINSLSTGGSGGEDRLTENISLNFAKVTFKYTPQKADGSADKTLTQVWDIAANVNE